MDGGVLWWPGVNMDALPMCTSSGLDRLGGFPSIKDQMVLRRAYLGPHTIMIGIIVGYGIWRTLCGSFSPSGCRKANATQGCSTEGTHTLHG